MGGGKWVYVKAPKRNNISQTDRGWWSDAKRLEAITIFLATGNLAETARQTKIPYETLMGWKERDWWKEKIKDIQDGDYQKLDGRMSKAIDKALEGLIDRIENGEAIYDPKTGNIKKMPAKMRDLNVAVNTLIDKRQLIRKQPTRIVAQESTAQQLQNLADQFAKFVNGVEKKEKLEDLTVLVEGEDVVQDEDGTYVIKDTSNAIHEERET